MGVREAFGEPGAALGEDLGVTVDGVDGGVFGQGHDDGFGAPEDLGVDLKVGVDEVVEGVVDGAFGGVLDGEDAVVGFAGGDAVEDAFGAGFGEVFDAVAEFVDGDLVGPGAGGTEVGDLHAGLEGESGTHDFAVDGADGFFGEEAVLGGVEGGEFAEELLFATGDVDVEAVLFFDGADDVDEGGALVEQLDELLVNGVDLRAGFVQGHEGIVLGSGFAVRG